MLLYLLIYLILYLSAFNKGKYRNVLLSFYTLFLAILCALRGEHVGIDTQTYLKVYKSLIYNNNTFVEFQINEPVAAYIMKFGTYIWFDCRAAQISVSLFSILPLIWIFRRISPLPLFSLFLYYACNFYLFSFNGARQMLALPVLLICFYFISEKKSLKAIVAFIIAILLHNSSLFCLPAFFINRINLMRADKILILMTASLTVGLLMKNIVALDFLFGSYSGYVANGEGFRNSGITPIVFTILMNAYFLFVYMNCDIELRNNPWMKLFLLAILINNATFMLQWGTRLYLSTSVAQVILYPIIFSQNRIYKKSKLKSIILLYILINFCRVSFTQGGIEGGEGCTYPYYTFFEKAPY